MIFPGSGFKASFIQNPSSGFFKGKKRDGYLNWSMGTDKSQRKKSGLSARIMIGVSLDILIFNTEI